MTLGHSNLPWKKLIFASNPLLTRHMHPSLSSGGHETRFSNFPTLLRVVLFLIGLNKLNAKEDTCKEITSYLQTITVAATSLDQHALSLPG